MALFAASEEQTSGSALPRPAPESSRRLRI